MIFSKLITKFQRSWTGLAAQGLTLGSSLVPIYFHDFHALILVVTCTAAVTIITPALTLCSSHVLPVIIDSAEAKTYTLLTVLISTLGSLICGLLIAGSPFQLSDTSSNTQIGVAVGLLCFGQTLFYTLVAFLTRNNDFQGVMTTRLTYGLGVFLLTVLAGAGSLGDHAYVNAIAVAFILSTGFGILKAKQSLTRLFVPVRISVAKKSLRRGLVMIIPLTLGTFASQLGALITPFLGVMSPVWAVGVRLLSGVQTVGSQIIGVDFDVRLSSAIRNQIGSLVREEVTRSVRLSWVYAISATLILTPLAFLLGNQEQPTNPRDFVVLATTLTIFSLMNAILAPLTRLLGFISVRARTAWDTGRFLLALCSLLLLNYAHPLVLAATFVSVLSTMTYIVAMLRLTNIDTSRSI